MAKKNGMMPYILFGVPLLIGGYFIYKSMKPKGLKKEEEKKEEEEKKNTTTTTKKKSTTPKSTDSDFPLKKGSKGSLVKQLQQALGGKSVLKKYGADGGFGSETEVELVRVTGKKTVDSQQELEQIASKRNLAIRNGQVLPIGIAASTTPLLVIKDENSIKDAITGVEIYPFIKF